jgi:hypothetical protein
MTEQEIKNLVTDFSEYVDYVWGCIGLPGATPIQKDICNILQDGNRRLLIEAFRGVGKTYLTGAYATWRLLRNPNEKVLIVSASGPHATAISTFIHKLLSDVPILGHLQPRGDQRNSVMAFDVDGCLATVQPSVKCLGINSQLQGNRASLLIADDVETSINSATEIMRGKILQQINEFDSILQTNTDASIVALGTPQTGNSVYNRFIDKGFLVRIWPSRIPEKPEVYEGRLAPYIENMIALGEASGSVTDTRFTNEDLLEREGSVGKSYYKLQYQLDTTLSDADRYPLKQEDLVVMDIPRDKGPISLSYSSGRDTVLDIPNIGFTGDAMHGPQYIDKEFSEYSYSIMSIDPSGRGADEMGYSVVKYLHGRVYVVACGGMQGGYQMENLVRLATIAKDYKVNTLYIESNFGDGMFDQLLRPVLKKIHPVSIEEVRSSKQKELRIIDTMEPLLNQHKLVFDAGMVRKDIKESLTDPQKLPYGLMYQMTHITRTRGCLGHDDRLDALAIALAAIVETVGIDEDEAVAEWKELQLMDELNQFIGDIIDPKWTNSTLRFP